MPGSIGGASGGLSVSQRYFSNKAGGDYGGSPPAGALDAAPQMLATNYNVGARFSVTRYGSTILGAHFWWGKTSVVRIALWEHLNAVALRVTDVPTIGLDVTYTALFAIPYVLSNIEVPGKSFYITMYDLSDATQYATYDPSPYIDQERSFDAYVLWRRSSDYKSVAGYGIPDALSITGSHPIDPVIVY